VFCARHLLFSSLCPNPIDAARHGWAILSLLVKALRRQWPKGESIFRGDRGFCRWKRLRWCDRHDVRYIVGRAKNQCLQRASAELMSLAEERHEATGKKQHLFTSIQ